MNDTPEKKPNHIFLLAIQSRVQKVVCTKKIKEQKLSGPMTAEGRLINNAEVKTIFGTSKRGIVKSGQRVTSIKVILNSSRRYPNEVNTDYILYCYCKTDVSDNVAMQQTTTPFRVHVVSGNQDYDWGYGLVDATKSDSTFLNGHEHQRFFISKMENVIQSATTVIQPTPPRALSRETYYKDKDIWFDSYLEACHALFMDIIGVTWMAQPIQLNRIILPNKLGGKQVVYIPDFSLHFKDRVVYLEIKPLVPYDVEEFKCMELCRQTQIDVVLLYNKKFAPCAAAVPDENRSYDHSSAIRGFRYSYFNGSISRTEVAWAFCNGAYDLVAKGELCDNLYSSEKMLEAFTEFHRRVPTSFQ